MYFTRIRVKPNIQELSHLHCLLRNNSYGVHQLLWDLMPRVKQDRKDDAQREFLFREEIAREQLPHYKGARGEPLYYVLSQNEPSKENPLLAVESKLYEPKIEAADRFSFKLRANPVQTLKEARQSNEIESWHKKREQLGFKAKNATKKRIRHDVVMAAQSSLLRELSGYTKTEVTGKKSDLKKLVYATWITTGNEMVTSRLKESLQQNERYREFLEQHLSSPKLFDLAFKATMDLSLEKWLTEKGEEKGFKVVRDDKRKCLRFQAEGYRWNALPQKSRTAGFSSVDFEGVIEVTNPRTFVDECLFKGIGPAKGFGCGLMMVKRV